MSGLVDWPAAERNKQPILEVLARVLPKRGLVLEIASATGQHVAHFAKALPELTFQPSDFSEEHLQNLRARRELAQHVVHQAAELTRVAGPRDPADRAVRAGLRKEKGTWRIPVDDGLGMSVR